MDETENVWPLGDSPSDEISIYEGPDVFVRQYSQADRKSQVAFATYWFQAEVLNGGLRQFFWNDTGVLAPEAAFGCRALGLVRLATKLEEAMAWFGSPYPRHRQHRQQLLEACENGGTDNPFVEMDDVVANLIYEEGSGLEQAAIRYLQSDGN